MTYLLVVVFGVIPVAVLGLLATAPLLGGLANLFEEPARAAMFFAWGLGGWIGATSMFRAAFGRFSAFTPTGLVIGIMAVTPLAYFAVTANSLEGALWIGYWTISPIVVAGCFLALHFFRAEG